MKFGIDPGEGGEGDVYFTNGPEMVELATLLERPYPEAMHFYRKLRDGHAQKNDVAYFMKQAIKHLKMTPEEARTLVGKLKES